MLYMGMRLYFRNRHLALGIFIALLSAYPAAAAEGLTPISFKAIYDFGWAGMVFGRIGIEAMQTSSHYDITSDVLSTGIANLFTKHSSHTTVDATGRDFTYPNRDYETNYQTKNKKKYVKMSFKDGKLVQEVALPADPKRSPVPVELKERAYDPLSYLLALRKALYDARTQHQQDFRVLFYDGRRLYEGDFSLVGEGRLRMDNEIVPVIHVVARRKLLAGFTPQEIQDFNPNESLLHIYFSNDARLVPLRLEFGFFLGTVSATLAKECRTGESCLFGLKD